MISKKVASKTASISPAVPPIAVEQHILLIRSHKVLLDASLAALYEVPTKALVQAVKRNLERFPGDFMFQLSEQEFVRLRSQTVTSNGGGRGGRRTAPYAFTEQGVAMLSTVLRSPRAIAVNIEIMRTFVRLRQVLAMNKAIAQKLDALEKKLTTHDQAITGLVNAIRLLTAPPANKRRGIGFVIDDE